MKLLRIGLLLAIITIAALFFTLDPTKYEIFPKCLFHSLTGLYCPGCGSQRALHSLLHFNFYQVVGYNFLFIPAALFIAYHYLHMLLNRWLGWNLPNLFYKKNTPWVVLVIVVLFWIVRNIPVQPFSILAPG